MADFTANAMAVCEVAQIQLTTEGSGDIQLEAYPSHDLPRPGKVAPKVYQSTNELEKGADLGGRTQTIPSASWPLQ